MLCNVIFLYQAEISFIPCNLTIKTDTNQLLLQKDCFCAETCGYIVPASTPETSHKRILYGYTMPNRLV